MNEIVKIENKEIVKNAFKSFNLQISDFEEINKNTVFDYEDKKGEKEARSHVNKLRKTKKPINDAHKEAKSEALKLGQALDAEKRKLIGKIDEMIQVHDKPLKEIKEKREKEEAERIAKEKYEKDEIEAYQIHEFWLREQDIKRKEEELRLAEEKRKEAEEAEKIRLQKIKEAEEAEKIRLQEIKDAEERAKKEAEEQVIREKLAKEQAIKDKEAAIKEKEKAEERARIGAEQVERKRLYDIEEARKKAEIRRLKDIENEKIIAAQEKEYALKRQKEEQEHERIRIENIKKEKERIKKEKIRKEKEEAERKAADRNHQKNINNEVLECLKKEIPSLSEDQIKSIIVTVIKGKIKNVAITY